MVLQLLSAGAAGHAATPSWAMFAYLVSGVLFILALRGLSSPATSRAGNRYGMIGMLIAVATTLVTHVPMAANPFGGSPAAVEHGLQTVTDFGAIGLIVAAIALGGAIGFVIARRIAMTAMPQLVAAFHSLVGMAAVLVGWAAYLNPQAFGIENVQVIDGTQKVFADAAALPFRLPALFLPNPASKWASASPSARSPFPARSSPSSSWRAR
jgi:NAD(P) transhydrogenase subunit beta